MASKKITLFKAKNNKTLFINYFIYLFLILTIIFCFSSILFTWGVATHQSSTIPSSYLVSPVGFTTVSTFGDVEKPFYSFLFDIDQYQPMSYPFLLTGLIIFPLWLITLIYTILNLYKLIIKKEQNSFGYCAGTISIALLASFLLVFYVGFPLIFPGLNIVYSLSLNVGFYLMFITTILFFVGSKISKKYLKLNNLDI